MRQSQRFSPCAGARTPTTDMPTIAHPTHHWLRRATICGAALLAVAVLLFAPGCGSRTTVPDPSVRTSPAHESAAARVARARVRAEQSAHDLEDIDTWMRFNPAPCLCPNWEVRLYGRWERVAVRSARGSDLGEILNAGPWRPLAPVAARIRMTRDSEVAETGWRYHVVEAVTIDVTSLADPREADAQPAP